MRLLRSTRTSRKLFCILTAGILLIFIYNQFLSYSLLTEQFPKTQDMKNCDTPYRTPIDVVYTWVNGSEERFLEEMHRYAAEAGARVDSYAAQRFSDKDELKFSLRSLEKHMNWFRHVYIVTNGQIPSWLNLDYDRVSVVTHAEIFQDGVGDDGDLPTFSSPAIEANLHRIPGLSERFIYFNDDVFLNGEVLQEDFHTRNRGFKIYTAWGTDCAPKCEWSFLQNGKCEPACYNFDCDYDAGDCERFQNITNLNSTGTEAHNLKQLHNQTHPADHTKALQVMDLFNENTTNITLNERIKRYNNEQMRNHKILRLFQREKSSRFVNKLFPYKHHPDDGRQGQRNEGRKDLYSASLIFTQKLLGKMFGYRRRNVIAHAPLMIDRGIMSEVQQVFPKEFRATIGSRFRKERDLQIAFVYSYYLSLAKVEKSMEEIFMEYDTDLSGTWSDREIHTLMTRLYPLPLKIEMLMEFQSILVNCSKTVFINEGELQRLKQIAPKYERYVDSPLSIITKQMITECRPLQTRLKQHETIVKRTKYKHEFVEAGEHVSFNQLHSVASYAMNTLNHIRRNPKKFVCINDDLDRTNATRPDNELLLTLLEDFFMSLLPTPSKFELPPEYRNRFARIDDLRRWENSKWRRIVSKLTVSNATFLVVTVLLLVFVCFRCFRNR